MTVKVPASRQEDSQGGAQSATLYVDPLFEGESGRNYSQLLGPEGTTFTIEGLKVGQWKFRLEVKDVWDQMVLYGETVYRLEPGMNHPVISIHKPVVTGDVSLQASQILDLDPGNVVHPGDVFQTSVQVPELPDGTWMGVRAFRKVVKPDGTHEVVDAQLVYKWVVEGVDRQVVASMNSDSNLIDEVYVNAGSLTVSWLQVNCERGTEAVIVRLRTGKLDMPSDVGANPSLGMAQVVEEAVYPFIQ